MPSQVVYRVRCPICGARAELRAAVLFDRQGALKPTVAEFFCPYQGSFGHGVASDQELLKLPAEAIERIPDRP